MTESRHRAHRLLASPLMPARYSWKRRILPNLQYYAYSEHVRVRTGTLLRTHFYV